MSKREADDAEPKEPEIRKSARTEAAETAEAADTAEATFQLRLKLLSGRDLVVTADRRWTVQQLQATICSEGGEGGAGVALLAGDRPLQPEELLADLDTESLVALRRPSPTLHLFAPCSARELSARRGCQGRWLTESEAHI
ncbi:unnamed protein product, partial [Effrenium voratum]